jgi:DNA polymerase III sliding clamp (beta) subunit (PCNA family)
MSNEDYLFYCKTREGYVFKVLFELLKNCVKSSSIKISKDGLTITSIDTKRQLLLVVKMDRHNFNIYRSQSLMNISVNLTSFYNMLKTIKKKDGICLYIESSTPNKFHIIKDDMDQSERCANNIQIMKTQDVEYDDVEEYKDPIIIPAKKLQNTLKDISTTKGRITEIESNVHHIRFYCDNGSMMTADKRHGDIEAKEDICYKESFDSSLLVKLQKILGLSQNAKVYVMDGCPLKVELNIGSLGTIGIYIKSREIVERESAVCDEDSD